MQLRGPPKREAVMALAEQARLDLGRLERDMQSAAVTEIINANRQLAQNLNIRGTPTLIIGDTLVPGAIDLSTLRNLVAEARSKCTTC
jgi:protein-disulfide isomerase